SGGNVATGVPSMAEYGDGARRALHAGGIRPLESWEAGEVRVGRAELGAVLDGEGGEVGVRDQWPRSRHISEEFAQDRPVPLPGLKDPHVRASEPTIDQFRGDAGVEMRLEPTVRRDAEEAEQ